MVDWLSWLLQALITWSSFVGFLTAPISLLCFAVAAARVSWRSTGAQWGIVLLWPWHAYLWAMGIALCFSAWGWWGWAGLFALSISVGKSYAPAVGIFAAFAIGQSELGAGLIVIWLGLFVGQLVGGWLILRSAPPDFVAQPQS